MSRVAPRGTIPEATVRGAIGNALQVFSDDIVPFLIVFFIMIMVGAGCGSLFVYLEYGSYYSSASFLLIAGPLEMGVSFLCLRAVRSGRVSFDHLFSVFNRYPSVFLANALMTLIFSSASLVLLIPGIVFFCATRFVSFLLLEDELGGAAAIRDSIRLSRQCAWQLLGICSVGFAGVALLVLFATQLGAAAILGIVPGMVLWNLSIASLYHSLYRPPAGWALEDAEELELRQVEEAREALEAAED
ncbi:MAG: hypothetical protein ACI8W3_000523 [Myxococcota bacterium]